MDDTANLIRRCTDETGRIDKRMLHARGGSDSNLFGADDANPDPLGETLLVKARGFSVAGVLQRRPFWVAVFWRGELGDQVQIRGWDSDWVRDVLASYAGDSFSPFPMGGRYQLRLDSPVAVLAALLELGGRESEWHGDSPPGLPRLNGCVPLVEE